MAGDGGHRSDQAHGDEDIACRQRGADAAHIGGQIQHLHAAACVAGVQLGEADADDHQEGAGAGAVIAVVGADDEGGGPHDELLLQGVNGFRLVGPAAGAQGDEGHDGQNHQQEILQDHIRRVVLQPRADDGACHRQENGGSEQVPLHEAVFNVAGGGEHRADAGGELVGAQHEIGGEAVEGQQVGGHGNDTAAAGDGVHETGQKHTHEHQQDGPQGEACHHRIRQKREHRKEPPNQFAKSCLL